ncbi:restriction endonuclease subunit S [Cellvibrio sp. OA-2007]|uniref:restriction endonuclease subunit S n=1 Tax=Cellvibrio sp. OA-2007 TaxID=529823 RepID=UPI000A00EC17|nr:restriction endonuclease subunit S [Cellvibrio sp. OA-2007]
MSEFTLPEGWVETPLGEYLYLKNGYAFKSNSYVAKDEDTVPVIRISDIDGKLATDETAIHVRKADVVAGFEIKKGDLLIAMSGATTGKVGVYNGSEPAYQNQRVGNLKLHSDAFGSAKYKDHLIASLTPEILKVAYGGAQPNISGKAIEEFLVALPPLAEQQQIAQKLDELLAQVDTLKARLDAIPNILKRFRQSVIAAAVSGRLTEEWRGSNGIEYSYAEDKLSNLINEMRNGLSAKPNEQGLGVPILRISSVRSLFVDQVDVRFLELDEIEVQRYSLKPEDLLFTRYNGSLEFVGVCGQVRKLSHENLVYPDKLIRVRVNKEKIIPSYLELYYASADVREFVMSLVKSTSGQKGISGQDLKDMNICFPSVVEQTEIVRRVEKLFAYADQIEQRVKDAQARVNHLTQSILAKAFRGELTADWRAQNPELISGENSAAALLERIKVERAAAAKPKKKVAAR